MNISFNLEPIDLSHQEILTSRFKSLNLLISEYSFPNLYLFRQIHRYSLLTIKNELFIKGVSRDGVLFTMLTSPPDEILEDVLDQALAESNILFPIPDEWLPFFENGKYASHYRLEDSDYIYASNKLSTYRGRHFDGKRNQVNQLLSQHEMRCEELSHSPNDAKVILDEWQNERPKGGGSDYSPCLEAIELFDRLNLQGWVAYADGKPAGFIIGEFGQGNSFIVHFSKGIKSIKGITTFLFQEVAKKVERNCLWINLEQDLGIPALRYTKQSFHPDKELKKWRLVLGSKNTVKQDRNCCTTKDSGKL